MLKWPNGVEFKVGTVRTNFFDRDLFRINSEFRSLRYNATQCVAATSWSFEDQHGIHNIISTKGGAIAQTSNASIAIVWDVYLEHLNFCFADLHCPASSPYLSVRGFFLLWGHLKCKISICKSCLVNDLKGCNMWEVPAVSQDTYTKLIQNFKEKLSIQ